MTQEGGEHSLWESMAKKDIYDESHRLSEIGRSLNKSHTHARVHTPRVNTKILIYFR